MLNVISVRLPYLANINEIIEKYENNLIKAAIRRLAIIFFLPVILLIIGNAKIDSIYHNKSKLLHNSSS